MGRGEGRQAERTSRRMMSAGGGASERRWMGRARGHRVSAENMGTERLPLLGFGDFALQVARTRRGGKGEGEGDDATGRGEQRI